MRRGFLSGILETATLLLLVMMLRGVVLSGGIMLSRRVVLGRSCFAFSSLIGPLFSPLLGSLIGSLLGPLFSPLLGSLLGLVLSLSLSLVVVEFPLVVARVALVFVIFPVTVLPDLIPAMGSDRSGKAVTADTYPCPVVGR